MKQFKEICDSGTFCETCLRNRSVLNNMRDVWGGIPEDLTFSCEGKKPKSLIEFTRISVSASKKEKEPKMQNDENLDTLLTPFITALNNPDIDKGAFISNIRICCGCNNLQEVGMTGRSCSKTKCGGLSNSKPCPLGFNEPSWNPPRSFNQIISNVYVQLKDNLVERAYMNENPLFEKIDKQKWKKK